ncbi:TetR family transcriptional regulator [Pseudonocardia hierapolitana]|uniref:TetR family transcriptional regulator n=1 Tax=Pseudonocardia hierapolitana TaxID=1128676 RepID=A0A561SV75_9PSEU|nr:TetR/AcrR family transcriptional regulator [Pseudonocardia hierapolitana]TWF78754.1 TetR family transcriptional regulator [Pseudonocardia hierapolitana]
MSDRGERILDAAADLVLRWGYKRVTIEEVAKRAGIGKGTVYLHFRSRTWLFVCVLIRESLGLVDELTAAVRRDPTAAVIAEQVRLTYLEVQRRPLLRALFARDDDVLGELAHGSDADPVHAWRGELAADLFRLLREHGLMRTDLDVPTQMYVVGAVQTGFYLQQPALGSPEETAAALHHTVHAAVEPPTAPDPVALAAVAPAVLARYERFRATLAAAISTQRGPA